MQRKANYSNSLFEFLRMCLKVNCLYNVLHFFQIHTTLSLIVILVNTDTDFRGRDTKFVPNYKEEGLMQIIGILKMKLELRFESGSYMTDNGTVIFFFSCCLAGIDYRSVFHFVVRARVVGDSESAYCDGGKFEI